MTSNYCSLCEIIFTVLLIYFGAFQFENFYYDFLPDVKLYNYVLFEKKTFYDTIGATLIVLSIVNGLGKSLFSSKIGLFFGKISYATYLLHFLILCSLSSYMYTILPVTKVNISLNFTLYVLLVILLGYIFTKSVDRFAISASHYFSNYIFKNSNSKI